MRYFPLQTNVNSRQTT